MLSVSGDIVNKESNVSENKVENNKESLDRNKLWEDNKNKISKKYKGFTQDEFNNLSDREIEKLLECI